MGHKERGEKIRRQILCNLKYHPADITRHIAELFSVSTHAVGHHLRRLENEGWLASTGTGKGKRWNLGELRRQAVLLELTGRIEEDKIWRDDFAFIFEGLGENVSDICHYGFTEMVNNAIDHSEAGTVFISVVRNLDTIDIFVADDGEGIFRRIKRLGKLDSEEQALFELSKGKFTTDPENHTGQGIFFTSRMFKYFEIESNGLSFKQGKSIQFDALEPDALMDNASTFVKMTIDRDDMRTMSEVFDQFDTGPTEYAFNRTVVPVKLAQYGQEKLISRSQAKRMLMNVSRFQIVVLDFEGVLAIGQAFADEIFRVYTNNHPEIQLAPVNMSDQVRKMIQRAQSN